MRKTPKKVLFVHLSQDFGSLAIEYLSANLKRNGHQTDLIIHYGDEKYFMQRLYQKLTTFNPDFVGFSVTTFDCQWALRMAKAIKKIHHAKIIFGGIHPTSCPQETILNKQVDYVVVGEGDEVIVDIVENPEQEDIPNVYLEKNGKVIENPIRPLLTELDTLPFPDKDLFYEIAPYMKYTYLCIGGKGCPFGCSYCFNNYLKKIYKGERWVRKRSVDNLIEELKIMKKKTNFKQIFFYDDCFTSHIDWLKEFVVKYKKEIGVPFRALSHPIFLDKERISLLKEAGCIKLQVGTQTPIEKIRKNICKRKDTNDNILEVVNHIKKEKIILSIDHIFGLPTERTEDYYNGGGLDYYIELKPHMYFTFWLQYYPNTEITDIGKENQLIKSEEINRIKRGYVSYGNVGINKATIPIASFMYCIPYLPKRVSRYLLKKNLIKTLFRYKSVNTLIRFMALSLPHLYSTDLFKALVWELRKVMERKFSRYKSNKEGGKIIIPDDVKDLNKLVTFIPQSNYKSELTEEVGILNR